MWSSHIRNEVVDQWRRGYHMIGRHHADWYDIVGANDNGATRHRDHWIEIARSQRIAQVSEIVGEERLDECEISMKSGFNEVASSIDLHCFLAILDGRPDPCLRQDTAETISAGAYSFDQRALRHQLHFEVAGHH